MGTFTWVKLTDTPGFSKRDCALGFKHNGRLWLSSGYDNGGIDFRDLYVASDAANFTKVGGTTPYNAYAPMCSHEGWIYILNTSLMRTKNGLTYETVSTTNTPAFAGQSSLVSLGGKLVQIRGNSVCILEGTDWVSYASPWPTQRAFYSSAVFNGRIYTGCGATTNQANSPPESGYPAFTSYGDLYSTVTPEDPTSWVKHEVPYSPRMWSSMHAFGDYLYVVGGYNNFSPAPTNFSDTFRMGMDGKMERITTSASFSARHAPTLWDWNGRLILGAGNTSAGTGTQCDVWELREA